MTQNLDYDEPTDKQIQRLLGKCNNAPLLADDDASADDLVIKGIYDEDGELRTSKIQPRDSVEVTSELGIVVTVTAHTQDTEETKEMWRQRAIAHDAGK